MRVSEESEGPSPWLPQPIHPESCLSKFREQLQGSEGRFTRDLAEEGGGIPAEDFCVSRQYGGSVHRGLIFLHLFQFGRPAPQNRGYFGQNARNVFSGVFGGGWNLPKSAGSGVNLARPAAPAPAQPRPAGFRPPSVYGHYGQGQQRAAPRTFNWTPSEPANKSYFG